MHNSKLSKFISEEDLQKRITEIGQILTNEFKNSKDPLIAICVLKGSFMFFSDLTRAIDLDLSFEFLGVSSYHGTTKSSGEVKMTLDLSVPIEGKNIILIEDIVDTGLTMNYLVNNLKARNPKKIITVTLLHKPDAMVVPCQIDHVGFKIENDFVVGYGLDYQGYYRNLPYIAQVQNLN